MKTENTDVVAEYLREVDLRLAGLPVLQRRELLADLATHIATERAERNLRSEGELIEVLERLGSPDVVAAAAREEAGVPPVPAPPVPMPPVLLPPAPGQPAPRSSLPAWSVIAVIASVLLVLALCLGAATVLTRSATGGQDSPVPAPAVR